MQVEKLKKTMQFMKYSDFSMIVPWYYYRSEKRQLRNEYFYSGVKILI